MYVARPLLDAHIPQLLLMTLRRVPRDIPMPLQMRSIFREHCRILGPITITDPCQDANKRAVQLFIHEHGLMAETRIW